MKKHFAKIALIIVGLSLSLTLQIAYAKDPDVNGGVNNGTSGDTITDATLNVGKILTLDNGAQKQTYYNTDPNKNKYAGSPPLIAFALQTLDFATAIIGSLAMILLIIAGFRFMVAGGVQQKIDEAKDMIKFVLIGLVLTFLSYTITIFLQSVFIPQ